MSRSCIAQVGGAGADLLPPAKATPLVTFVLIAGLIPTAVPDHPGISRNYKISYNIKLDFHSTFLLAFFIFFCNFNYYGSDCMMQFDWFPTNCWELCKTRSKGEIQIQTSILTSVHAEFYCLYNFSTHRVFSTFHVFWAVFFQRIWRHFLRTQTVDVTVALVTLNSIDTCNANEKS